MTCQSTLRCLVAACSLTLLGACSTPPPGARGDSVTYEDYPSITVTDGLQPFLKVNGVNSYQEGGVLHVNADMRWTGQRYVYLEYRYQFRDANGRVLNGSAPWRRAEAAPGTRVQLAGNATDEQRDDQTFQ